ncbi:UDP-N-acetylglucosamine--N-acetylmuramyl-(pentapeptide) pyrophosphoryl-undecaprenol N-acetylglucosamine transferase [Desulfosarcina widdelii]|uniref:UDP-N-acetylglucosamine--N-acetylmuramyl-(pentapeptide) pyrophosphoryl-undecaprenol N-acetylglucosamine transferase n=1 Tax=Desulfosarcina widdelii TaxID=947919 RepID=A0A5K7Z644_9BACT|nr:undecaprenyldiphospho-muramoylpentapeptide beta-N-acetylglucosaminyltransferase [Desulfosarcina widdelii]BBO75131.1 UDP-N-acetylglucosamine--N-acetylmuramyl-(pentapeptide) pyrophosphoryl-undecaprenol N-acetylglucosamine transferase [Desulfosarcina widdelii]
MRATETENIRRSFNVAIAGGGTGGHLFPGIAVAEAFRMKDPQNQILFVGVGNPFEKAALERAGYPQRTVSIEGIKGRGLWAKARAGLKIPIALFQAAGILREMRADLVVGVGGYAAGPVAMAAWFKRIPVVICEQNTVPGITNRLLFPVARRIYLSFEATRGRIDPGKKRVSGNPVRQSFIEGGDVEIQEKKVFTVLVVGGSQGAHAINMAFVAALVHLRQKDRICIVHQTGAADQEQVARAYAEAGIDAEVKAFFHDMASRYRRADLVVCRAGATTVAELTALGKAALFVPYPYAADNHQEFNARALVDAGAAQMVLERDLSGAELAGRLDRLAENPAMLADMAYRSKMLGRPEAAEFIVEDCYNLLCDESCT